MRAARAARVEDLDHDDHFESMLDKLIGGDLPNVYLDAVQSASDMATTSFAMREQERADRPREKDPPMFLDILPTAGVPIPFPVAHQLPPQQLSRATTSSPAFRGTKHDNARLMIATAPGSLHVVPGGLGANDGITTLLQQRPKPNLKSLGLTIATTAGVAKHWRHYRERRRKDLQSARNSTKATVIGSDDALQRSRVHDLSAPRTKRRVARPGLEGQLGSQSTPDLSAGRTSRDPALARLEEIRAMRCKLVGGSANRLPPLLQAQFSSEITTEASAFGQRHQQRGSRAHSIRSQRPASQRYQAAFPRALFDVSTNRFITPLRPEEEKQDDSWQRSKKEGTSLGPTRSIWAPRARWCDSKSLYDTDECEAKGFEVEWQCACALGLAKLILKRDDGDSDDEGPGGGDECSGEVHEVQEVLWDCHDLITQIFDLYSSVSGTFGTISFNQWKEFVNDFKLASEDSKFCKTRDLSRLFIAVNAASKFNAAEGDSSKEQTKTLERVEFIMCLVNLAIMSYVMPGTLKDVSEALHVLVVEHMEPQVDKKVFADYNIFRHAIYQRKVNEVLLRHEESLRNMFAVAAAGASDFVGSKGSTLLGLLEWKAFLKALRLIGKDVSDRDASLCFACSRMAVADPYSKRGKEKQSSLPFEGFLEAWCRLSVLKALPTNAELEMTDSADAGVFLQKLESGKLASSGCWVDTAGAFYAHRAVRWGDTSPLQSVDQCVHHLTNLAIRTLLEDIATTDVDMSVSINDARKWAKAALGTR